MLPIYNEYIEYLKSNNISEDWLKEGYFWLDRQIIKGFVRTNDSVEVIKLMRVNVSKDLSVSNKYYKKKDLARNFLTWEEVYGENKENILELEKNSIKLISKELLNKNENNIILTSSGKDSNLTEFLTKKCIDNPRVIFSNTSLDVADTYRYIKQRKDIEIINPKEGFYQWRKRLGFIPTRFARACCTKFKEGELTSYLDSKEKYLFIMGMRNQESANRSGYGDYWKNEKWGDRNWNAILSIRKWDELSVWLYTIHNHIDINLKYKKGYSRVGCGLACPFYNKAIWSLDKFWYTKQFNRWRNILKSDFIDNHKVLIMNCTLKEYMYSWNGGVVREDPSEEVIEEFANMNNLDFNIAKKYFNHTCEKCGKKVKHKEDIAMNMKLHGRNTSKFYCKKHLMKIYNMNIEDWQNQIDNFKKQGCDLF